MPASSPPERPPAPRGRLWRGAPCGDPVAGRGATAVVGLVGLAIARIRDNDKPKPKPILIATPLTLKIISLPEGFTRARWRSGLAAVNQIARHKRDQPEAVPQGLPRGCHGELEAPGKFAGELASVGSLRGSSFRRPTTS